MLKKHNRKLIVLICKEELLLPFNEDHLIELFTEDNLIYIPLFTDVAQTSGLKYTRLDNVKLKTVISDIYSSGKYYAITVNPFTDDIIFNSKTIDIIKQYI